jgi:hypothetical protein
MTLKWPLMLGKPLILGRHWSLESLVFSGAYLAAIAVAAVVLASSRGEVRSVGAWLVFIVFVACLTAILALFRKARVQGGRRDHN